MQPIKRGFGLIQMLLIMAVVAILCAIAIPKVKAQEATPHPWYKNAIGFKQGVEQGKALSIAVYPSYAPSVTVDGKKAPFGFGAAALYPVMNDTLNGHAFAGGRIDYLAGNFWAPSATVGAKGDVQLFGKNATAYLLGGTVVPISGAGVKNGDFGTIYGGFVNYTFSTNLFNLGIAASAFGGVEKWSNLPGNIYHGGLALTKPF